MLICDNGFCFFVMCYVDNYDILLVYVYVFNLFSYLFVFVFIIIIMLLILVFIYSEGQCFKKK